MDGHGSSLDWRACSVRQLRWAGLADYKVRLTLPHKTALPFSILNVPVTAPATVLKVEVKEYIFAQTCFGLKDRQLTEISIMCARACWCDSFCFAFATNNLCFLIQGMILKQRLTDFT